MSDIYRVSTRTSTLPCEYITRTEAPRPVCREDPFRLFTVVDITETTPPILSPFYLYQTIRMTMWPYIFKNERKNKYKD